MSFLDLLEEKEEKKETVKESKKEAKTVKRERKVRSRISQSEIAEIKQSLEKLSKEVSDLKLILNNNNKLLANLASNIAKAITNELIQQLKEELSKTLQGITKHIIDLETVRTVANEAAKAVAEEIRKKIRSPSIVVRYPTLGCKPAKIKLEELKTLEEKTMLILWYRRGGVMPVELAQKLKIDPKEAQELLRKMREEKLVIKKRVNYRYILNVLNPKVVEFLKKFFDDELIEARQKELRKMIKSDMVVDKLSI